MLYLITNYLVSLHPHFVETSLYLLKLVHQLQPISFIGKNYILLIIWLKSTGMMNLNVNHELKFLSIEKLNKFPRMRSLFIVKNKRLNQLDTLNCGSLHMSLITHFTFATTHGLVSFGNFHNLYMMSSKRNSTWIGKIWCLIRKRG